MDLEAVGRVHGCAAALAEGAAPHVPSVPMQEQSGAVMLAALLPPEAAASFQSWLLEATHSGGRDADRKAKCFRNNSSTRHGTPNGRQVLFCPIVSVCDFRENPAGKVRSLQCGPSGDPELTVSDSRMAQDTVDPWNDECFEKLLQAKQLTP